MLLLSQAVLVVEREHNVRKLLKASNIPIYPLVTSSDLKCLQVPHEVKN
jgi:orotate phosphoribosyltransferase